ncbi:MAG TPA: hypothetical protein VHL09_02445 [Dehalococcoidia bacterium]|nr:hypothetical protein [Dehalococcoidia bacterium]
MAVSRKREARSSAPDTNAPLPRDAATPAPWLARRLGAATAVAAGLGMGLLATLLLFDQRPGLGFTLLVVAFGALLFALGYIHGLKPLPSNA